MKKIFIISSFIIIFYYYNLSGTELMQSGVKAISLGGAYSANIGDGESVLYNPAGLAEIKKTTIGLEHSFLYAGLNNGNIGSSMGYIIFPIKSINTAAGIGWDNTAVFNVFSLNNFRLVFNCLIIENLSIIESVNIGMNLKYILIQYLSNEINRNSLFFMNSDSKHKGVLSSDIGFILKTVYNISAGVYVADINKPDLGIEYSNIIEYRVKCGLVYNLSFIKPIFYFVKGIKLLGEYNISDKYIGIGVEIKLSYNIFIRTGIRRENITAGIGWEYSDKKVIYGINYGLEKPFSSIIDGLYNHRISLSLKLP